MQYGGQVVSNIELDMEITLTQDSEIAQLIEETNKNQQPILLKGNTGNAVLISESEWNAIQETLYLQSMPGMVESIQEAAATPLEDCIDVKDIEW